MSAAYGNSHRAFLQALLSRQAITYEEARPLLAAIQSAATPDRPTLSDDVSLEDLDDYVDVVNAAISSFDLEIRSTTHQSSKERVYALVNTTSDALTQMATVHSADEIAFVKRMLDVMFDTNNTQRAEIMAVTSTQALNVAKAPHEGRRESGNPSQPASMGLTKTQAEKVMENLVGEGWLELSAKGYYSLTPRALMELRGWLVETYNEQIYEDDEDEEEEQYEKIKSCQACREIVTVGQRCPKLDCQARLHDHCARNMFRAQGGEEKCPKCRREWTDPPPVGEKAARLARSSTNGAGVRRSSAMNSRRVSGGGTESDDE